LEKDQNMASNSESEEEDGTLVVTSPVPAPL